MKAPDVLGMPEEYNALSKEARDDYWIQRNALVDKVLAATPEMVDFSEGWGAPGAAERRAVYRAALDELEAFDLAHGCTPIL